MTLNINTDAAVVFTNTLEQISKNMVPTAVRGALNKAGFDLKQRSMPLVAGEEFEKRQPNFFKANSRVEMAKGNDIRLMQTTVGFIENKLKGGNNYAVQDLEQQERGGIIKKRSFIPVKTARVGGSNTKIVSAGNRLSAIKKIVNSNKVSGRNPRQKFLKAAAKAGPGGFVIGNQDTKILYKVLSIKNGKVKLKALYDYVENRSVAIKATGFMERASIDSGSKIEDFYIAEAKRLLDKY